MELINYINSLHNLNASGTNSLAESQVNSSYFKDIYHPFPIVESLKSIISEDQDAVIILTGHAGDGKSTIAFELLRELGTEHYPQGYQFKEHEYLEKNELNVLKDMSELSLENRRSWLRKAFNSSGNWLIVSNTGPLLTSIASSLEKTNWTSSFKAHQIESKILEFLDKDIAIEDISNLRLDDVNSKAFYIVNIAKLNNIEVALNIFKNIINHPGWQQIIQEHPTHPIIINHITIKNHYQDVEESIRLTYLYLLNYEKRMTLRQMLAHLSVSLTAGMSLSNDDIPFKNSAETLLFSDTFFGYIGNRIWHKAKDLKAIDLVSRIHAGKYTGIEIENFITDESKFELVNEPLKSIIIEYINSDKKSESHHEKAALRRILFMYGINKNKNTKSLFLGSTSIYKFNNWQINPNSFNDESRRVKRLCEKALNLFYSGSDDKDNINITLKRSDSSVFQIAQLMVCSIAKNAFRIDYDNQKKLPFIHLKKPKDSEDVRLDLSLPLLDYIENIVIGDVTESLNPIYKTQLERFKLSLIDYAQDVDDDAITLVRMKSDESVNKLEIYFEQSGDHKIIRMEG
ncbi:hypothetical protein [Psychrobacter sp. Pi2-1]|uniref:hypothetical protein n=1 Tax=Psychrobacter sp. Pi2-1 TaxID=2774131 RepID=UPI00191A3B48|nr:hypothetical protein [Psychrobacter sp. Pi2-1]